MPPHLFQRAVGVFVALTLVDIPPPAYAQTSAPSQDSSNCSQTDDRLPKDWFCSDKRNCISLDNAGAVLCCAPAYGCAKLEQQPCSLSDPFWTDRVRTYSDKDPRRSCSSGLCCPLGYQCIDARPREAGYCVLNRGSARYPNGLDPDDWQNCANDCNRLDVCCPDMCEGNQCTKTATIDVTWVSISPAQLTMGMGSSDTSPASASTSLSSRPSTTSSSSHTKSTSAKQDESSSAGTSHPRATETAHAPRSSPSEGPSSGGNSGGVIAGALVGGLALLCALLGVVFCLRKRHRNKKAVEPGHDTRDLSRDQITPGRVQQRTSLLRSASVRSPGPSIASQAPTATSTTVVSPPCSRPSFQETTTQNSRSSAGMMYPFIREDEPTPMSPISTLTSTEPEAGRGTEWSHGETVQDAHSEAMIPAGDGTTRNSDPNGSEAYEMERWGKPIKQTNVD